MPESQGRGPGPVLRWAVSSSRQFTTAARSSGELSSPAAGGRLQLGDRVGAVCGDQQQVGAEGGPGRLPGDTEHNLLGHHLQCPDDFASCQVFGGRWSECHDPRRLRRLFADRHVRRSCCTRKRVNCAGGSAKPRRSSVSRWNAKVSIFASRCALTGSSWIVAVLLTCRTTSPVTGPITASSTVAESARNDQARPAWDSSISPAPRSAHPVHTVRCMMSVGIELPPIVMHLTAAHGLNRFPLGKSWCRIYRSRG